MMTNFQLEDLCEKNDVPLVFCGYKDDLAHVPKRNGGYIVNLRDSTDNKPGTHWVAFYIQGRDQRYFDSFGFEPPEIVEHFLNHSYHWNVHQIQNIRAGHCGQYCFGFLLAMSKKSRGETPTTRWLKFLHMFSEDVTKNDDIIDRYLKTATAD